MYNKYNKIYSHISILILLCLSSYYFVGGYNNLTTIINGGSKEYSYADSLGINFTAYQPDNEYITKEILIAWQNQLWQTIYSFTFMIISFGLLYVDAAKELKEWVQEHKK